MRANAAARAAEPVAPAPAAQSGAQSTANSPSSEEPADDDAILHVRRRLHLGRWVLVVGLIVLAVELLRPVVSSHSLGWPDVGHFLFNSLILDGVEVTLEISVVSMVLAVVLGAVLAGMGHSTSPVLRAITAVYVWFFRGVPLLVQILVWYNLAIVFPVLSIGVPFAPWHVQGSTNTLISPFLASVLALGLAEAAYMAEVIRGGIVAVPVGQVDAALSIGLTRRATLRRVVLPQATRAALPPTGNQFIGILKATSLVSVIGGNDLLTRAQVIYAANFKVIALLLVASAWYLLLTSLATVGLHFLERRLDRDDRGGDRPGQAHRWPVRIGWLRASSWRLPDTGWRPE